nr:DNA (cytosine-5-)-methyltransferase [Deinococcus sp. 6YEL10]
MFAGAGGMALGFERAGLDHRLLVEFDRHACDTLAANRPAWTLHRGDVRDVSYADVQADVLAGGFPCQSFSHAGKRLGMEDTRGTLFYEIVRAASIIQPRLVLLENVQGLLTHDGGRTFDVVQGVLANLGYTVDHRLLNAADFGAAQRRMRVVIAAHRLPGRFVFPEPTHLEHRTLRQALDGVPASPYPPYSPATRAVFDLVPAGGNWRSLPDDVKDAYMGAARHSGGGKTGLARRLSWDQPCPTVTTSPSQKLTGFCHPSETRPLAIREYARVQGFPDDWQFSGPLGAQYRQVGNAVPVALAEAVGRAVAAQLATEPAVSRSA